MSFITYCTLEANLSMASTNRRKLFQSTYGHVRVRRKLRRKKTQKRQNHNLERKKERKRTFRLLPDWKVYLVYKNIYNKSPRAYYSNSVALAEQIPRHQGSQWHMISFHRKGEGVAWCDKFRLAYRQQRVITALQFDVHRLDSCSKKNISPA